MTMDESSRRALLRATELALEWHRDQKRRGSGVPYVSHLIQVAGLVLEHGGDAEQAVGAWLHDSLEDAQTSTQRAEREALIRREFGDAVLRIVLDCTDTGADESIDSKRPWKQRKQRHLAHLANCDERSLLVAACDKRHNLHALVWDVRTQGRSSLDRFRADAGDQIWYFENIASVLANSRIPRRLKAEIGALLEDFRNLLAD